MRRDNFAKFCYGVSRKIVQVISLDASCRLFNSAAECVKGVASIECERQRSQQI
jgi:hypothetical protein